IQTPFFCEDSYERFNYYYLTGNPATMVNGNRKIVGYTASQYPDLFQNHFEDASINDSTFVSDDTMYGTYNDIGDVYIYYTLTNNYNKVFSSFLGNSTVYVAVVEDVINYGSLPAEVNTPILRLIGGQSNSPTLQFNESFSDTVNFNYIDDMELITGDINNCRIVCWLQNNNTKRVYHVSSIPFGSLGFVDIQEDEIEMNNVRMQLFPNPYKFKGSMQISFNTTNQVQRSKLKIYNIRGQLVKELSNNETTTHHTFFWNGYDASNKEVSSGVYLMKLITESDGRQSSQHQKCLLLKK
ncbi:T9SS type A sorting domain-containing protein, partial [Candidatus Cloacimonadota bacterium]